MGFGVNVVVVAVVDAYFRITPLYSMHQRRFNVRKRVLALFGYAHWNAVITSYGIHGMKLVTQIKLKSDWLLTEAIWKVKFLWLCQIELAHARHGCRRHFLLLMTRALISFLSNWNGIRKWKGNWVVCDQIHIRMNGIECILDGDLMRESIKPLIVPGNTNNRKQKIKSVQ